MCDRQTLETLLDTFSEDPETTIAMLNGDNQVIDLLDALLKDVPKDINWLHLIRMANGLREHANWFHRIVRTANDELRRRELLQALVDYGTNEERVTLVRFEDAVANGIFHELTVYMPRKTIERLVSSPFAHSVVTAHFVERIQHFLENGDLKRAFDELAASTTILTGWRPPLFEKWVGRVWQAHRDKNLVIDLTDDPMDWRNCTADIAVRCGELRGNRSITSRVTPQIQRVAKTVPMILLWGPYTEYRDDIREHEKLWTPIQRAQKGFGQNWAGMKLLFPVNRIGAMLRDMITRWHQDASERELREFCSQHNIPYSPPT